MPLVFTQEELAALAMSLVESSGVLADQAASSAASKVLQGLPARAAAPAQSVLGTATVLPGRAQGPSPSVVLQLANATEQAQRVEIDYRSVGEGQPSRRMVEPWGLVVRHQRWYLIGHSPARAATRTYRVDRIEQVHVLSEGFEPPDDIDVAAAFEDHLQNSWAFTACVDLDAPLESAREWIPFTMGVLTPTGPAACRLVGNTNNCQSYITDLLQTPFAFTVRGGPELLDAVRTIHARLGPAR